MELTADDLWPLVAKLPREERIRLARRALASVGAPDRPAPVAPDKPVVDGADPLAWDAQGWENIP
jgi:hypothetical protein